MVIEKSIILNVKERFNKVSKNLKHHKQVSHLLRNKSFDFI